MKTYTVHLSDEDVERLRLAAEARHQTPDEALQATVEEAMSNIKPFAAQAQSRDVRTSDPMIAVMRERGHLTSVPAYQPPTDVELPKYGSPEFDQLLEQIGAEASDALEQMGLDVIDLVER